MLHGTGKYTYELVDGWAKCPEGCSFSDVVGLSIDSQDRVYVVNRGAHRVTVFDREGNLLTSWREGLFKSAHGIHIGPDDSIYFTDIEEHTVSKFTPEGKLLMVLGNKDQPSDSGYVPTPGIVMIGEVKRGGPPFNGPTDVALSPSGEIYVSDGYGNARIHKFSPDGTLLLSWGEPGDAPGQFRLPHSLCVDKRERVWVTDQENNRIQIFDARGELLKQWIDLQGPNHVFIDDEETVYVSEVPLGHVSVPSRVSIFTIDGKLLARLGMKNKYGDAPGQFRLPHSRWKETDLFVCTHTIAMDSHGDLYVGEVSMTYAKIDRGPRTVQKLARRT